MCVSLSCHVCMYVCVCVCIWCQRVAQPVWKMTCLHTAKRRKNDMLAGTMQESELCEWCSTEVKKTHQAVKLDAEGRCYRHKECHQQVAILPHSQHNCYSPCSLSCQHLVVLFTRFRHTSHLLKITSIDCSRTRVHAWEILFNFLSRVHGDTFYCGPWTWSIIINMNNIESCNLNLLLHVPGIWNPRQAFISPFLAASGWDILTCISCAGKRLQDLSQLFWSPGLCRQLHAAHSWQEGDSDQQQDKPCTAPHILGSPTGSLQKRRTRWCADRTSRCAHTSRCASKHESVHALIKWFYWTAVYAYTYTYTCKNILSYRHTQGQSDCWTTIQSI